MRTVAYSEVLQGVADEMGWKYDEDAALALDAQEWHAAKRAISKAYQRIHVAAFWRELTLTELRRFKPVWSAIETYGLGEFVFYENTGQYYQSLQASAAQAPATLVAGAWVTNLAYWAEARRALTRTYWDAGVDYAQGDIVFYEATGLFYQAHTASLAGVLPTDLLSWGEINELDAFVPYVQTGFLTIDQVAGVYRHDPRENRWEPRVPYTEAQDGTGIWVRDPCLNEVWVVYMFRPWKFKGNIWDATLNYTPDDEDGFGVPTVPVQGTAGIEFATVALMLASDTTQWTEAWCQNWDLGDQIKTEWRLTAEVGLLPNGDDIQLTNDGAIVVLKFRRLPP